MSYSNSVSELFNSTTNSFENNFLSFWDKENNFISTSSLDPLISANLENVSVLQGQMSSVETSISNLSTEVQTDNLTINNTATNNGSFTNNSSFSNNGTFTNNATFQCNKAGAGLFFVADAGSGSIYTTIPTTQLAGFGTLNLSNTNNDRVNLNVDNSGNLQTDKAINLNSNALTNCSITNCSSITLNNTTAQCFKNLSNIWYVSINGSNTTGQGTQLNPYATIQYCIQQIEANYNGTHQYIQLSGGCFTENITFTYPRISINGVSGFGSLSDTGSCISGTITLNIINGNTDMNNNNVEISNLLVNGKITNTSSVAHRLNIQNCYLYGNDQVLNINTSGDYRFNMNFVRLSNETTSATNELVYIQGSGMSNITNCIFTQKGKGNVLKFNGGTRIDTFSNNLLMSDSSDTAPKAILSIVSSNRFTIANSAFVYTSLTLKSPSSPNFSTGILYETPTNAGAVLVLLNNFFSLTGTGVSSGHCVNSVNSGGCVVLYGGNISGNSPAGSMASGIVGTNNVSKFAMTNVS